MSALIRTILTEWLAAHPDTDLAKASSEVADPSATRPRQQAASREVKLSIPVCEALVLARRARAAEMSQGKYVARLVLGSPPPPASPELKEANAALTRSTATLAALCVDLQALARSIAQSPGFDTCTARTEQLSQIVKDHLILTAPLLAALNPPRRAPPSGTA
ncbi:MAG: hypothetical protein JO006_20305 [Paucibacter sp.]|nr:hypothetical protein [Roseateles sp.]